MRELQSHPTETLDQSRIATNEKFSLLMNLTITPLVCAKQSDIVVLDAEMTLVGSG